jgi:Txe/YoeB family toxin of Txe-Axe toxin-antitoxin module
MQAAIYTCIERVVDDPGHPGLKTHPVQSAPGVFSSRVDRGNRLTWTRDEDVIVLLNHCNHDEIYRRP